MNTIDFLKEKGLETDLFPCGESLLKGVDEHVTKGWKLFHPIDDLSLIAGYTTY